MARSTYIYLAWDGPRLLGAFTVKHELERTVGIALPRIVTSAWHLDEASGIAVQRLTDGKLRT